MTDPKDKALEAAVDAGVSYFDNDYEASTSFDHRDTLARAITHAIAAFRTALPSDHKDLLRRLRVWTVMVEGKNRAAYLEANNAAEDFRQAADAIEALEAKCLTQRRATTWYFEKMNEAEKRAEAAEAKLAETEKAGEEMVDRFTAQIDQLRERVAEWERLLKRSANTLGIYDRVHGELEDGTVWEKIDNGMIKEAEEISYEAWSAYMRQRLLNFLREYHLSKAARAAPEKQT